MRERLLLIAGTLAAFGSAAWGSFHFDDYAIFSSPSLTSPSGWWEVWGPLSTRPLAYFTFWLNCQLGGSDPLGFHLVNLALHLAAVLLLWELLRHLIPPRAAFIGALLFAVHPIQSEPVAYVFARPILLAAVFCLLSAIAWLEGRPWLAVLCFALALAGKEEAAAFPLVLWMLPPAKPTRRNWPILAMLALSLAAGLRVIWVAKTLGTTAGAGAGISPLSYLLMQGEAILRYLRLCVIPWGFTVDTELQPGWIAWISWALLAAAIAFAWKRRWLPFLAALVLLIPSSSVFPVPDLAADRRMYLPMLALSAGAGLLLAPLRTRWIAALAVILVALSIGRMEVWRTEQSLWEEAVERSPGKVRPKIQLARVVAPDRALQLLREARALAPDDPQVPSEIGRIELASGGAAEALAEFGRGLALAPRDPRAFNNRGTALAALGQTDSARRDFERALALDPCLFEARLNLRAGPGPGCRYTAAQQRALAGP
ncbi:MAG: tetratricopeptide repeat protein [Bryobacteraceae bacterium]